MVCGAERPRDARPRCSPNRTAPGHGVVTRAIRVVGVTCAVVTLWLTAQVAEARLLLVLAGLAAIAITVAYAIGRTAGRWLVGPSILLVGATLGAVVFVGGSDPNIGWFGGGITHGPAGRGLVALTFDDGPHPTATLQIATVLERAGARGSFFEIGRMVDAHPEVTRALVARGHLVGNHSYAHDRWRWLDPRYPELTRAQAAFRRAGIGCPVWFRPPHGQRTPFVAQVASAASLRMALWNDSASDWALDDPHEVARRVLRKVHDGSIVLLHDGLNGDDSADRSVVVRALPEILAGLHARGLRAVRLDQLLGGPLLQAC